MMLAPPRSANWPEPKINSLDRQQIYIATELSPMFGFSNWPRDISGAPMPRTDVHKLGDVCHEWNYQLGKCQSSVSVETVQGSAACHFIGKLAVDADGSPKAYHPLDKRPYDNGARAYDWLANINVKDLFGIQGENGTSGPNAGYYVSGTSLINPAHQMNDARRYVDAGRVPYFVLPIRQFPSLNGTTLKKGCIAFIFDTRAGGSTGAIFADVGRAVGEGSIALAERMGLKPFHSRCPPKVVGFDGPRFFYLIFPDVFAAPPWDVEEIETKARDAFAKWGGEAMLREVIGPIIPQMQRARPVSPDAIERESFESNRNVPEELLPDFESGAALRLRSEDVPKSQLDAD